MLFHIHPGAALAAYRGDGEIICEGIELRRLKDVE